MKMVAGTEMTQTNRMDLKKNLSACIGYNGYHD